jgi:acyl-CoA thioesterase-1
MKTQCLQLQNRLYLSLLWIFLPSAILIAQGQPIRVACVGNSITWGGLGSQSYPEQMAVMLGPGYDVRNFGSSGRTMLRKGDFPYWQESIFYDALDFDPHIVVIELGTNDSKPQNWVYGGEYGRDYLDMIAEFRKDGRHPEIYVCFPPPAFSGAWGITDTIIHYQIIPKIDSVRNVARTLAIDFYSCFTGKGDVFPDGIHPNAAGYTLMAQLVADSIAHNRAGVVRYFFAGSAALDKNQSTSLYWKTSTGSVVTLDGTPVAGTDSVAISPAATTSYRLTAKGPSHSDTLDVRVRCYPPGAIKSASAHPRILAAGSSDSASVSWVTSPGTTAARWDGTPALLTGSMTVAPVQTTMYTLTTDGELRDTSRVTVAVVPEDSVNRAGAGPTAALSFMRHNPPGLAVDGDHSTYWMSSTASSQWLTTDLQLSYAIDRIIVQWGPVPASTYYLQIIDSSGAVVAMKGYSGTGNHQDVITDLPGTGRTVKLLLLKKTAWELGYTVCELAVFGHRPAPTGIRDHGSVPLQFQMEQNYPNPFNPSTRIRYCLPEAGRMVLRAYNVLGQQVDELVNSHQEAGWHEVEWTPALPSGACFLRAEMDATIEVRRCLLLR